MIRTLCLAGAESTGKSWLAVRLGAHFSCNVVPEYGRTYCEIHGNAVSMGELVHIAEAQTAAILTAQAEAVRDGHGVVISDTDAVVTAIWADMMYGERDIWFDTVPILPQFYLVPDIDLPWEEDGLRVYGRDYDRARFLGLLVAELEDRALPYAMVRGRGEARFDHALAAIAAFDAANHAAKG